MSAPSTFTITVTSDVICPFCPLGLKRLQRAIEIWHKTASSKDIFELKWKPFYLSAPSGVDKTEQMREHHGFTEERARLLQQKTREKGQREGVSISFNGTLPGRGTRDAHRLIRYAEIHHPSEYQLLVEELFRAFHEKEEDVSEINVIVRCAEAAGIKAETVKMFLEGDGTPTRDEIDKEAQSARERGIKGVPYFEINEKWIVDGAYEPGEWLETFNEIKSA